MGRPAHCARFAPWRGSHLVGRELLFFAIMALIAVEIVHLKWIWWTYWDCRKCGRKHSECGHGAKWMFLL